MPTSKEWATFKIRKPILVKLKQVYDLRKHELLDQNITSVSGMVEKYLVDVIEKNEAWKGYMPFLAEQGISDEGILIRDNRLNKLVQLSVKGGDLYCDLDDDSNCVHIGFAWSIPQVYRVMKEHGRKQPK